VIAVLDPDVVLATLLDAVRPGLETVREPGIFQPRGDAFFWVLDGRVVLAVNCQAVRKIWKRSGFSLRAAGGALHRARYVIPGEAVSQNGRQMVPCHRVATPYWHLCIPAELLPAGYPMPDDVTLAL